MKTYFSSKILIALAVAIAAAAAIGTQADEQPIPPPSIDIALPAGIPPGSPVAQVVKLVQAGVDASVIQTYITNCPSAFNLDADKIIALADAGLPSDLVNLMFEHDNNFLASLPTAAAPPPSPAPAPVVAASPPPVETASPPPAEPPTEVTVNYFHQNLSPYGSWVEVDGYGRCWRPNIVVYDTGWRPYCDRGRWVYSDCGWYWDSDYSWGMTFHYGRWFNSPSHGWCWWPDTVWAPSWVTWRSSDAYCGWAPLPPRTVYRTGIGFSYCGDDVAVSFGFGLSSSCYTFVNYNNFCQPNPRRYCAPVTQVNQFYSQTTVINNFDCKQETICNQGVSATSISQAANRRVEPVPIGQLVNPGRRGWHGNPPGHRFGANADANRSDHLNGSGSRLDLVKSDNDKPIFGNRRHSSADKDTEKGSTSTNPREDRLNGMTRIHNNPATMLVASAPKTTGLQQTTTSSASRPDTKKPFINGRQAENITRSEKTTSPQNDTTAGTRENPQRNWAGSSPDRQTRSSESQVTRPDASTTVRTVTPKMDGASAFTSRPAPISQTRETPRQFTVTSKAQPSVPSTPVAVNRPQSSEPRQGFSQRTPSSSTSSGLAISNPARQTQPSVSQGTRPEASNPFRAVTPKNDGASAFTPRQSPISPARETPRQFTAPSQPQPSVRPAPVVVSRPQSSEPRQSFSPSAPRSSMPAVSPVPSASQSGNGQSPFGNARSQGAFARNP
jgi:hypothetical protein